MRELTRAALSGASATGPDRVADLLSRSLDGRRRGGTGPAGGRPVRGVLDGLHRSGGTGRLPRCPGRGGHGGDAGVGRDRGACRPCGQHRRAPGDLRCAGRAGGVRRADGGGRAAPGDRGTGRRVPGWCLDTGLADALVTDTLAEPGGLPLLSTALTALWEQREDARLTLAAYATSGGVGAAIAHLAEQAYRRPRRAGTASAARILLRRLAGPGQGDGVVRRRVALAELDALPDPRVRGVRGPVGGRPTAHRVRRARRGGPRGAVPVLAAAARVVGRGRHRPRRATPPDQRIRGLGARRPRPGPAVVRGPAVRGRRSGRPRARRADRHRGRLRRGFHRATRRRAGRGRGTGPVRPAAEHPPAPPARRPGHHPRDRPGRRPARGHLARAGPGPRGHRDRPTAGRHGAVGGLPGRADAHGRRSGSHRGVPADRRRPALRARPQLRSTPALGGPLSAARPGCGRRRAVRVRPRGLRGCHLGGPDHRGDAHDLVGAERQQPVDEGQPGRRPTGVHTCVMDGGAPGDPGPRRLHRRGDLGVADGPGDFVQLGLRLDGRARESSPSPRPPAWSATAWAATSPSAPSSGSRRPRMRSAARASG